MISFSLLSPPSERKVAVVVRMRGAGGVGMFTLCILGD